MTLRVAGFTTGQASYVTSVDHFVDDQTIHTSDPLRQMMSVDLGTGNESSATNVRLQMYRDSRSAGDYAYHLYYDDPTLDYSNIVTVEALEHDAESEQHHVYFVKQVW